MKIEKGTALAFRRYPFGQFRKRDCGGAELEFVSLWELCAVLPVGDKCFGQGLVLRSLGRIQCIRVAIEFGLRHLELLQIWRRELKLKAGRTGSDHGYPQDHACADQAPLELGNDKFSRCKLDRNLPPVCLPRF